MLFRFIDRKSIAIPPKFFPKSLKDFPQLDFSSEITLKNKRKNEEKITKPRFHRRFGHKKPPQASTFQHFALNPQKCIVKW